MIWFGRKKGDAGIWEEMNREVMTLSRANPKEAFAAGLSLLEYSRKGFGKKDQKTVTALNNLGTICTLLERFDDAESYLLAALQMSEKINGMLSKETLVLNMNLARLYTAKASKINDAIGLYQPLLQTIAES